VSPRRREPDPPTARRLGDNRPAEMRPQMDGTAPEARRAWRTEDRPGLEMAPPPRWGDEGSSFPPDWGSDRGSWSRPPDRGGDRGFAPSAQSSGGGRGSSRRR
jgi:hypothetical protein